MKVIWAPRAIERAAEIARYIAADHPDAAERWVDGLFAKAAGLQRHARRGSKAPELDRDDVRQLYYGKHRTVYGIDQRRVTVLTVRHGRRGWDPDEVRVDE